MTVAPADAPDSTAVRVALWRAMHVQVDPAPHVLEDLVGLQLAAPNADWRDRPDMHPIGTRGFRAAIVARARFIEDLVDEQVAAGVAQFVVLGAGLDTLAQRRPDLGAHLRIYEVDQPGTQAWKRRRLEELGFGVPDWLRLVPIDFETGESWWDGLMAAGFEPGRPAVVASTGVSMYLSKDATASTLRQLAALAPGSTLAMTFLLPAELVDDADRQGLDASARGARASRTPFVSFYAPDEMLARARDAGFRDARHISSTTLAERYFAGRADGLRPSTGEDILLATT
ncbi:MAG: class I SAM-dependent methyltransferase [Acidimicrobiales bacterium]